MPGKPIRLIILGGLAIVLAVVLIIQYALPSGDEPPETAPGKTTTPTAAGKDDPPGAAKPASPAAADTSYRRVFKIAEQPRPADLPALKKEVQSPSWKNRHAAVVGIGRLKDKGDPATLQAVLTNADEKAEVRAAAAEQLGEMRHVEAGPALIDTMSDQSALLRAASGVAITKIMGIHVDFRAHDTIEHREAAIRRARDRWERFYQYHQQRRGRGG